MRLPRPIPELTALDITKFWGKVCVRSQSECWPWKAGKANGYGYMGLRCPDGKIRNFGANRISLCIKLGVDPGASESLHTCDNPECCNPDHLYGGDQADNVKDMLDRGKYKGFFSQSPDNSRGANNPRATLSNTDVLAIRRLASMGVRQQRLGLIYGVNKQSISNIILRKSWKHI